MSSQTRPEAKVYAAVKLFQSCPLPKLTIYKIDTESKQVLVEKKTYGPARRTYSEVKRDGGGKLVLINHRAKTAHLINEREKTQLIKMIQDHDNPTVENRSTSHSGCKQIIIHKCKNCENSTDKNKAPRSEDFGADIQKGNEKINLSDKGYNGDDSDNELNAAKSSKQSGKKNDISPGDRNNEAVKQRNHKADANEVSTGQGGGNAKSNNDKSVADNKNQRNESSRDKWSRKRSSEDDEEGGGKPQPTVHFTAEDDEKLKILKAAAKSWREIAQEMKRPQQALKKRFKEISNDESAMQKSGEGEKGDQPHQKSRKIHDENASAGKKENSNGKNTDEAKKANRTEPVDTRYQKPHYSDDATQTSYKAQPKSKSKSSNSQFGNIRYNSIECFHLRTDKNFNATELEILAQMVSHRRFSTWLEVSSKFFDHTGRRVHPLDIREKLEHIIQLPVC